MTKHILELLNLGFVGINTQIDAVLWIMKLQFHREYQVIHDLEK